MRTRAWRRAQRSKRMVRALAVMSGRGWLCGDYALWYAQRFCDNMKRCSCPGCGNPRRHFGQPRVKRGMGFRSDTLTTQERRAAFDWDQVAEFFAGEVDSSSEND